MIEVGLIPQEGVALPNDACFRIRRDEQTRNMLFYMEQAKASRANAPPPSSTPTPAPNAPPSESPKNYYTNADARARPAGPSPYHNILELLCLIPYDDDELASLRVFFYDEKQSTASFFDGDLQVSRACTSDRGGMRGGRMRKNNCVFLAASDHHTCM